MAPTETTRTDAAASDDAREQSVGSVPNGSEPADGADTASARTRTTDASWFRALVDEHADAIVRYAARRAARSDADDLAADVFEIAWRRRDALREAVEAGAGLPWLYATARNVVNNHHRKITPLPIDPATSDGTGISERAASVNSDPELAAVLDDELRAALALVDGRDREVLLLRAWEGLDGNGIAHALGISRSGADAALSRARSRLRSAWTASGRDPR
ncbi:sigma-70 family RNA polymerase sigma factor [uncultured Microbacterium sp.]|uniref:RNA polymerase sigma factor n=1 Tax=uncultured Microbacterium sp. TaxID=191216 RepID=UPI0025CDC125|nr:sigma-70 family RNA polymerase sigma factor [uncultured Microbacterium sp.]